MKIIFAIASFVISAALLGFITVAIIEGITLWGFRETAAEIFGYWFNTAVATGCVMFGTAFLWLGVHMLSSRRATNSAQPG